MRTWKRFQRQPTHRWTSVERSEEHTSELQSRQYLVCRLLLEKKKRKNIFNRLNQRNQGGGISSRKDSQNHESNIKTRAPRTGMDMKSKRVLYGRVSTIRSTI